MVRAQDREGVVDSTRFLEVGRIYTFDLSQYSNAVLRKRQTHFAKRLERLVSRHDFCAVLEAIPQTEGALFPPYYPALW